MQKAIVNAESASKTAAATLGAVSHPLRDEVSGGNSNVLEC